MGELSGQTVEERKRKLDGRVLRYRCAALHLSGTEAVLAYRSPRAGAVADVRLPAGTLSLALYWTDRPYNVYRFVDPAGGALAYYFNAATETRIGEEGVDWLDLELDLLVTPDGRSRVLDLEEVPADLSPAHRAALKRAQAAFRGFQAVVAEVAARTDPLLARG